MVLTLQFWNEIKNSRESERPAIVRKHNLTFSDIEKAGKIITSGKLEEAWFEQLFITCKGCGLSQANAVFEKYGIPEEERPALKSKIVRAWIGENNTGKFNN